VTDLLRPIPELTDLLYRLNVIGCKVVVDAEGRPSVAGRAKPAPELMEELRRWKAELVAQLSPGEGRLFRIRDGSPRPVWQGFVDESTPELDRLHEAMPNETFVLDYWRPPTWWRRGEWVPFLTQKPNGGT
jgi:hypothetical protein